MRWTELPHKSSDQIGKNVRKMSKIVFKGGLGHFSDICSAFCHDFLFLCCSAICPLEAKVVVVFSIHPLYFVLVAHPQTGDKDVHKIAQARNCWQHLS